MILIRRFFGLLLIIATAIGLIFSLVGIYFVWNSQAAVATSLQTTVDLLGDTLGTTSQGLAVTKDSLKNSVATIANMQTTLETTAKTIESTNPLIDEIANLMNEDLPNTIEATRNGLLTAQESAQVIDQVLVTISAIPLLGSSVGYKPDVPLAEALGNVANSLEDLPASFDGLQESLRTSQSNMQTFTADLSVVATSVGQIEDSVAQYEQVVEGYQSSLGQVQANLDALSANIPNLVRTGSIALIIFLVWMALAQIGLFTQGWEMFTLENI